MILFNTIYLHWVRWFHMTSLSQPGILSGTTAVGQSWPENHVNKRYSTFPKSLDLESHYQMVLVSYTGHSLEWVLPTLPRCSWCFLQPSHLSFFRDKKDRTNRIAPNNWTDFAYILSSLTVFIYIYIYISQCVHFLSYTGFFFFFFFLLCT